MNKYEYACKKCPHKSTQLVSTTSKDTSIRCSKCGSTEVTVSALPPTHMFGRNVKDFAQNFPSKTS